MTDLISASLTMRQRKRIMCRSLTGGTDGRSRSRGFVTVKGGRGESQFKTPYQAGLAGSHYGFPAASTPLWGGCRMHLRTGCSGDSRRKSWPTSSAPSPTDYSPPSQVPLPTLAGLPPTGTAEWVPLGPREGQLRRCSVTNTQSSQAGVLSGYTCPSRWLQQRPVGKNAHSVDSKCVTLGTGRSWHSSSFDAQSQIPPRASSRVSFHLGVVWRFER